MINLLTITYLFLGGTGAGACLMLTLLSWVARDAGLRAMSAGRFCPTTLDQRFFGLGYAVTCAVQLLGMLCLVFELGRPNKAVLLLTSPSLSVTSVGAYALGAIALVSLALAVAWLRGASLGRPVVRVLSACAVALALVVMVYTALLLQAFAGAAFWKTPLLVALFALSAVSTGTACVLLAAQATQARDGLPGTCLLLVRLDRAAAALEALVTVAYLAWGSLAAPAATSTLLCGDLALPFWAGYVACSLLAPLALGPVRRLLPRADLVPPLCALVLVGGFFLRLSVALVPR